jgi:hypothetical protein
MFRRLRRHDNTSEANGNQTGGIFQHALFALGQDNRKPRPQIVEKPANADIGGVFPVDKEQPNIESHSDDDTSESDDESNCLDGESDDTMNLPIATPTSNATPSMLVFKRPSFDAPWKVSLTVSRPSASGPCVITLETSGEANGSVRGHVLSLNGTQLGSHDLMTVKDVLVYLRKETVVKAEFVEVS